MGNNGVERNLNLSKATKVAESITQVKKEQKY
jgi:hypothetical protein